MKFKDVPRGIRYCCGCEPHVFIRMASWESDDRVMVMGTGAVVHISTLTGSNCLERDDYFRPYREGVGPNYLGG